MSLLTVASIGLDVAASTRLAPEQSGSVTRSYAWNLRSTVRHEKRGWRVTTTFMLAADIADFVTAIAGGIAVACSGDLLGATISCIVTLADSDYAAVSGGDGLGFMRPMVFTLREV